MTTLILPDQLAFRSVQHSLRQLRARLRHLLFLPDPRSSIRADPLSQEMEETITIYLKKTLDKYDCTTNIEVILIFLFLVLCYF